MNNTEILNKAVLHEQCLLHGSGSKFNEVWPHFTDGEMAICATPFSGLAIFMGVVVAGIKGGRSHYKVFIDEKKYAIDFVVCNRTLDHLLYEEPKGVVHLLHFTHFQKKDPVEHRAYDPMYSMRTLTVTKKDLPFMPLEGQTSYRVPLNPMYASVFS